MTEQLTGYEASSVAEVGAILDALPADAAEVYLLTMAYSERAIAAVAAKRAGGGGSLPNPFIVTGTDPNSQTALIHAAFAQADNIFSCEIDDGAGGGHSLLSLGHPGSSGFEVDPNPDNNTGFLFQDSGQVEFSDQDGDVSFSYTPGNKNLDLDPQNGQVAVLQASGKGFLRLAASSEPADSDLAFNGCFILYIDGSDLKAKAKIGDAIVHATLGTFA
jgi:hypothetical protein